MWCQLSSPMTWSSLGTNSSSANFLPTLENWLPREPLPALSHQRFCSTTTTGDFGWKIKNLTHFTFRTNCETFCNMIVFGKAESTQTKGTAEFVKGNVDIYSFNLSFQIIWYIINTWHKNFQGYSRVSTSFEQSHGNVSESRFGKGWRKSVYCEGGLRQRTANKLLFWLLLLFEKNYRPWSLWIMRRLWIVWRRKSRRSRILWEFWKNLVK